MVSVNDYSYYSLRKFDPIFWFSFLRIVKFILWMLDQICIAVLGTSILNGTQQERVQSKNYENSAHVVKVLGRGTICLIENHNEDNFLYLHESYQHPSYILKHDNIVLKGVNHNHAIFVVTDKDICALDTSIGPFAYINTFIAAKKLILLPIEHFHRLAEEAGNPFKNDLDVVMIHMTARCGSTLLGQMFESIPNTRVISETFSFLFVWNMYLRGDISYVEYEHLLKSTFQIQCKKEKQIQRIVMKHNMSATACLQTLKTLFPEIKLIFITRHPLPSLKSYDKLWSLLPISGTIAFLANVNDVLWKNYPIPCDDIEWWRRYRDLIQDGRTLDQRIAMVRVFFFNYWCVVDQYIKNKKLYEKAILYEDLCKNPKEVISDVFSALNISLDNTPLALRALERDSQQGFFGKRGVYIEKDLSTIMDLVDKKFKQYDINMKVDISMEEFRNIIL